MIVKNLTDLVEKAFDDFRNEPERYEESYNFVYYDSKSPKTFCDVQEKLNPTTVKPETTTFSSSTNIIFSTKEESLDEASNSTSKPTSKKQRKPTSAKRLKKRAHSDEEASLISLHSENPFLDLFQKPDFSTIQDTSKKKSQKRHHDEDKCVLSNIFKQFEISEKRHFEKRQAKEGEGGSVSAQGPVKSKNPPQRQKTKRPGTGTGPQGSTRGRRIQIF